MGGASAQVAFAPNSTESDRHKEDLMLLRLRSLDRTEKEYLVFAGSWLGYGANVARHRYIEELRSHSRPSDPVIHDPCLPKALEIPVENSKLLLLGTGSLEECLIRQSPILAKEMDCHDNPCLFGGVHSPAIDFDVNHFIGVSEFWHATHDVFNMGGAYDYAAYFEKVNTFCSRDWESILVDLKRQKWGKKLDEGKVRLLCFKAAWIMKVLHEGFGVPELAKEFLSSPGHNATSDLIGSAKKHSYLNPFTSAETIGGVEFSWTLGKIVLYSSSRINRMDAQGTEAMDHKHMVGFGPNNDRLYMDGEFYDPTGLVVSGTPSGTFLRLRESLGRRIPGLLLIFMMVCLAAWLAIGKGRRNKLLNSARQWFKRRKIMGAGGVYERLEAGDIEDDDDEGVRNRAWVLQDMKPPKQQKETIAATPSPRFDVAASFAAASSIGRSESRERLPSRPGSSLGRY